MVIIFEKQGVVNLVFPVRLVFPVCPVPLVYLVFLAMNFRPLTSDFWPLTSGL